VSAGEVVLACRGVHKTYGLGDVAVPVLKGIDLEVRRASRSRSWAPRARASRRCCTCWAGWTAPRAASSLLGRDFSSLGAEEQGKLRNRSLGFVYQFHHLLPEFSAVENVAMPLFIRREDSSRRASAPPRCSPRWASATGLQHRPGELSGGERQRVAVARALVTEPACVLADEPTGQPRPRERGRVFDLILDLNRRHGAAFVMVTHDPDLAGA
jgi:lipoprotein-releasing system ATP-binding protein